MNKNIFFILFQGRSGSSYLKYVLDSHDRILCKGEIFDVDKKIKMQQLANLINPAIKLTNNNKKFPIRLRRNSKYNSLSTLNVLEDLYNKEVSESVIASGFKFKYPNQLMIYPEVLNYLYEKKDKIKVILLIRNNPLKAVISVKNMRKLHFSGEDVILKKDSKINLGKLHLDTKDIFLEIKQRQNEKNDMEILAECFKNVLKISYEELFYNRDETIEKILRFLEVPMSFNLKEQTRKITPDNIKDAVSNYDELVKTLENTEFEKYLYEN